MCHSYVPCAAVQWGLPCLFTRLSKQLRQETKLSNRSGWCTGQVRNAAATFAFYKCNFLICHIKLQRWCSCVDYKERSAIFDFSIFYFIWDSYFRRDWRSYYSLGFLWLSCPFTYVIIKDFLSAKFSPSWMTSGCWTSVHVIQVQNME